MGMPQTHVVGNLRRERAGAKGGAGAGGAGGGEEAGQSSVLAQPFSKDSAAIRWDAAHLAVHIFSDVLQSSRGIRIRIQQQRTAKHNMTRGAPPTAHCLRPTAGAPARLA